MSSRPYEIEMWEGRDYQETFQYLDPDTDQPVDVTGFLFRVEIRPAPDSNILLGVFDKFKYKELILTGTVTVGDVISLTVNNSGLPGGTKTVRYTTITGDTLAKVASGLNLAINSDTDLSAAVIRSSIVKSSNVLMEADPTNPTSYSVSVSGVHTEVITVSDPTWAVGTSAVGGTNGHLTISMPASQTVGKELNGAHYDFLVVEPSGAIPNFLYGKIKFNKVVTKK